MSWKHMVGKPSPLLGKPAWNKGKKTPQEVKLKISQSLKGNTIMADAVNRGYKTSQETRKKISKNRIYKTGKAHPKYKGLNGNYGTLHRWIKKEFINLEINYCENCETKVAKKFDCANISGDYLTTMDDWVYLCRQCHILFDGHYLKRKRDISGRFTSL